MGAWLTPPMACERLETIVRRFGGAMSVCTTGGEVVEYALPTHATEEVRAYLRAQSRVTVAPGFCARLPGGRVFGSGNVLSPDGQSIARDVSEDFGKAFEDHWLLTYPRIRPPESIGGTTAVIATTQGVGYGHWLLEELPRLLANDLSGCDALIANVRERFAVEALRHHGFAGKVLPVRRDHHVQCEQLIVPSMPGPAGWPTPEVVRLVTAFGAKVSDGTVSARVSVERVYISRARAKRRRVANEETLWASLEVRGFRKVFLEELTWAEQIAAFRGAREVVAAHGAGLANLVFCEAGTRVVELFDRAYVNPCYWRLAALAGLDYRPVVVAGHEPLGQASAANKRDIEADVAQVERALG
jgi:capsular polysaccharide biosynthesis protein